jgi:hypothetical protein
MGIGMPLSVRKTVICQQDLGCPADAIRDHCPVARHNGHISRHFSCDHLGREWGDDGR